MAQSWGTVRVFISSTFRDMHAERDHLVKVVFPELRERCAKRRLHLIDMDLRWGVTEEEAEHGKVLEIILDEIDRSRPFFVAVLGERYGSVPEEVPEDAQLAFPWLQDYSGHSLTALEIVHGVLRNPDLAGRSFFYFRDPGFISQMPESRRADFTAEDSEAARKLAALKDKIRSSGRPVMEDYPCRWDDGEARLVDLDAFGQQVLEDVWAAICAEHPEEAPEADPLIIERGMHEAFAEERSYLHKGRTEQAARLTKYVQGRDRRPVVITGESGCGKSAFLADWYHKYATEHPDDFVLPYFIGASPDSTNHHRLLRNICEELKRNFRIEEEIPEEDKKLSEALALLLSKASRGRSRIIVLLDGLDQLSIQEGAHGLSWLLNYIPEKTRLVVSSLEGDCLDVLRRREAEEITLPPLSGDEQQQIVQALLGEWRRKLDNRQTAALLAHAGVSNPLYLRVALEELRLFGGFEELTERIQSLATDISGLFDQVLARLEQDHGRELVAEAFALLGCSRYGLSEAELLDLLRREDEEQLPRAMWVRLARSARAYLVQRGELTGFFHRQLGDAVAARYLQRDNKHSESAEYFASAPIERKLDEYPYQLQHAEQWESLATALSDLDFFEYACEHDRKYKWMGYWRSLEGRFEPGACYRATTNAREKAEGQTLDLARFLNEVGYFLYDMALYPSALTFYEQSLSIREKALGPEHPDVAMSLDNLAELYRAQGRYAEAEPLFKRALLIREKALGPEHPDVAISLNNLAELYKAQGRYAEAEPLYKRSLSIREKALGPDHPDVGGSLNNLAALYYEQCKYAEAESLYIQSLSIKEKALGPDHPSVAASLNNLGVLYRAQGRYAEAEPLYKRSLSIHEKALGPDHPDVAKSLSNLANLYHNQGKYAAAEPLCKRSLSIWEKALGPDHPNVAASLNNLANLYHNQGKYAAAERHYKRALSVFEKALGPDHPYVATSLDCLAVLYHAQGKYGEAEPLFKRALSIWEKALGPEHPSVATSLNNLAELYKAQGRYAEAEPLYKRSLSIREKALGPDHPHVATSLNNLARIYRAQGRYAEAEPLCKRGLSIREKALGPDDASVAGSLNNLAELYGAQGRYTEAEPLCKRGLSIREKALGPDHPDVAASLNNLANVYKDQGKYAEAEPLYKRAVRIAEAALGPDHPQTKIFREDLKACQYAMQRELVAEALDGIMGLEAEAEDVWDKPVPPMSNTGVITEHQRQALIQGLTKAACAKRDPVVCTVFAPPSIPIGMTLLVQVFAHLPELSQETRKLATEFDEEAKRRGVKNLETMIERGTELMFTLTIPPLIVDGPVQEIVWQGRTESVQFAVTVPEDKKPGTLVGTVTISQNRVPVGHIKFKLTVTAAEKQEIPKKSKPVGDEAHWYEKVFVSYASEDRNEVLKRVQMLSTLRIEFFQDILDLDPGVRWKRELYRHIDDSDLFLLFWSNAAKESEWVMKEVHYALDRKGGDEFAPPEILPVMIEGPPVPEPPQELAHLHFNDRLLNHMR